MSQYYQISLARRLLPLLLAPIVWASFISPVAADAALTKAIASPERSAKFSARDGSRHPAAELTFFGLKPNMTVVEIWPGEGYWTEILAPYLRAKGQYIAALPPLQRSNGEPNKMSADFLADVHARAAFWGPIKTGWLGAGTIELAPKDSVDLIVTFRNLHNWMGAGTTETVLAAFYAALKPGGILGIEDHRARADQPQDPKAKNGYVREDYTIALVEKAGFRLVGKSEINANPKDTKDWSEGVWTLPPVLTLGEKDRAKYQAIGEADNYVLKFAKPRRAGTVK